MLQRKYNTLLNLMTVLKYMYICAFLGILVCKGPLTKVPLCMSLCAQDDLLDLLPHAESALFLGLRETLNHPSVEWTGTGVGWLTPVPEVRNHFDIGLNATYAELSGKWNEVPKWSGVTISQLIYRPLCLDPFVYLARLKKGAIRAAHPYYVIYWYKYITKIIRSTAK